MAWRHPSRRWRAAILAALLTFGAYAPAAKSDAIEEYEYEIMILRVADGLDGSPGDSALCRWWYFRPDRESTTLSPIVPNGWGPVLGCEAVLIWLSFKDRT